LAQPVPARQPTADARRSQRHRPAAARAPRAYDAGVHLRPRLGPANSLSAVRVRGRRGPWLVKRERMSVWGGQVRKARSGRRLVTGSCVLREILRAVGLVRTFLSNW
jgi:hypothetical protein